MLRQTLTSGQCHVWSDDDDSYEYFVCQLYNQKFVYPLNLFNCVLFLVGMLNRLYGLDNLPNHIS